MFGFMASVLLARLLSPAALGAYFLVQSVAVFSGFVGAMGLGPTACRIIAECSVRGSMMRLRSSIQRIAVLTFCGTVGVGVVLASGLGDWLGESLFDSPSLVSSGTLMGAWACLLGVQVVVAELYRGIGRIGFATLVGGVLSAVFSTITFGVVFIVAGSTSLHVMISLAIASVGTSLALAASGILRWCQLNVSCRASGTRLISESQAQCDTTVELLSVSFPILISSLGAVILPNIGLWILGVLATDQSVAVFGASVRLITLVALPLGALNAAIPPLVAELRSGSRRERLEGVARSGATIAAIPSLVVIAVFLAFPGPLMGLIYGEYFATAGSVLFILSIGQITNILAGSCSTILIHTGHQRDVMKISAMTLCLVVLSGVPLAHQYDVNGLAVAYAIGLTVQNIVSVIVVRRRIGIWTHVRLPNAF